MRDDHQVRPGPDRTEHRPPVRTGVMISEFAGANLPVVLHALDYDFAIVDGEHGAFDLGVVSALATAARGNDLDLIVRIPEIRRSTVGPLLDLGARGVLAPMVTDVDQVRELVRLGRYGPDGERGISVTRAHSGFVVPDLPAYLAEANRRTELYIQLETAAVFDHVDEILAVPGLTGVFIGPNDLLQDLGVPGRSDDARLHELIDRLGAAASAAGLPSGIITGDLGLLRAGARAGMTMFCQGSEVSLLMAGARSARATLSDVLSEASPDHGA